MTDQTPLPTQTPNVVIRNPKVRQVLYDVLGIAGAVVFVASVVDLASPVIDLAAFTAPALAGLGAATAAFGFTARQNTPTL